MMSISILFAAIFLSLISTGIESFRTCNQHRNLGRFYKLNGLQSDKVSRETNAAILLAVEESLRREAIAAEVAATNIASEKSNACCAEDFCFPEPPATETGLDIRCLLTQNGLDVDWINPEDEIIQLKKDGQKYAPIDDEDVDDEDAEEVEDEAKDQEE
jgi:hypothetical protein